jgi:hypothetical protein
MIDVTLVFIGLVTLFAIFIALRSTFSLKICALCGAVSFSWAVLLILFYLKQEIDPVLIALLIGGSIVGFMYVLEQRLSEKYQLFKLPFFLTLISVAYFILERNVILNTVIVILLIWIFITFIHLGQNIKKLGILGKKIIECCKNW